MFKGKVHFAFYKSLKSRLILMIFVLVLVPEVVLCFGILNTYESRAVSIRESEVLSQAKILANKISTSKYFDEDGGDLSNIDAQIDTLTTIYEGRVLIVDKHFKIIKDTYNLDDGNTIISEEVIKTFSSSEITNYDSKNHYIELSVPISNPNDKDSKIEGALVVSVSTDNISLNMSYLTQIAVTVAIIAGAVVLFFGVLVLLQLFVPVKKLSDEISDIKDGFGKEQLDVDDYTETAIISRNFNELMSGMKFMGDITSEIDRETKIINDLLSLVKMDKSAATLNIESININDLLEQIMKRLQPIADKQQVELVLESFRPVTAEIDEVKLTLAFTNLIENAIKYNDNETGGYVHVSLNADHQYFYLKVEDNGIGIPEESLEHIYERFYRVDKSHSREIGGTGLGLAITRSSILMHRGAIKAHSVMGEGTTFDVRIPLNYIA